MGDSKIYVIGAWGNGYDKKQSRKPSATESLKGIQENHQ